MVHLPASQAARGGLDALTTFFWRGQISTPPIGDGNRHNHDNLPILLLGKGGDSIRAGRHIRYRRETPLNNLWLAMLDRMGAPTRSLGDSTGLLESLS